MNERYRLVRPLASGGMAELFLGIARGAEGFEKPVAIKRVLPYLAKDEAIARMFVAEARLATHLHHQNLVSVYDVGNDSTGLFLVMELVNGWDLGVLVRRARRQGVRFPAHLVAFIGAQALAGLTHAYRRMHNGRPVLTAHRDISPSNILVSREGEVKVTDFGIAKLEGVSQGTLPGVFKGKPSYAAPEVITGAPATAVSDLFSLGIVLHELLAGQHPFSDSTEAIIVAMAIASGTPPPLTGVPEPLAEVVMRALEKKPEARFAQPEDMAEALARYLASSGEPASSQTLAAFLKALHLPPTLLEQAESAPALPAPPPPPSELPTRASSPNRGAGTVEPTAAPEPSEPSAEWLIHEDRTALSMSGRLVPGASQVELESTQLHTAQQPAVEPASSPPREPSFPGIPLAFPTPSVLEVPPEQLEVEARAPREGTLWTPPRRSPWRRWALPLAVVGVLVAGGLYARPYLGRLSRLVAAPSKPPPLIIGSQPSGARVLVNGEDKGTTPLVMDNDYPPGAEVSFEVTLRGYKPWKGSFIGNAPGQFEVELQKR